MNTHVFIVNEQTFKYHLEYMFAGTGAKDKPSTFLYNPNINFNANSERNLVGMIADISRIQVGDYIIFYLQASKGKQGQFFGVFRAKSKAFFDENDHNNFLINELGKGLSYRVIIEPSEFGVFSKGVTEHEYLDSLKEKSHPYELCWSLIYRKLKGNRGCTMITELEFKDLLSKLKYINNDSTLSCINYTYDPCLGEISKSEFQHIYTGRKLSISIKDRLIYKHKVKKAFETHLQAYILQNIRSLNILDYPEDDFWIGNEVSCGVGMQRIDLLIMQRETSKVTFKVIELKDEQPTKNIVDSQLDWYIKWLFDYIIPNYKSNIVEVKPCIIAAKTECKELINYIHKKSFYNQYPNSSINNTEYFSFDFDENDIHFEKIL